MGDRSGAFDELVASDQRDAQRTAPAGISGAMLGDRFEIAASMTAGEEYDLRKVHPRGRARRGRRSPRG